MCPELRSPCILSLSWRAWLKIKSKKLRLVNGKYTRSWNKWVEHDISASVSSRLTFGDDSLQADDIRVRELTHDAGLAQEVLPLFLWVPQLQGLDRYGNFPSPGSLHHAPKHFPELSWSAEGNVRKLRSEIYIKWNVQVIFHLPTPMTFCLLMALGSISVTNFWMAMLGSSYMCGST